MKPFQFVSHQLICIQEFLSLIFLKFSDPMNICCVFVAFKERDRQIERKKQTERETGRQTDVRHIVCLYRQTDSQTVRDRKKRESWIPLQTFLLKFASEAVYS